MKNTITTLLLILCACTCVSAQATYYVDAIVGNGDSARLRVVNVLLDGSSQTHTEPYDSTYKVLEYARVVFVSGGFVGVFRSESPDEIEQTLRESVPLRDGIGINRGSLKALLIDNNIDPVANDTSYYASIAGSYEYALGSNVVICASCSDTGDFEIEREFGFLWMSPGNEFENYSVYPLNENMFQILNSSGKLLDVYVRDGTTWKSLQGCVFQAR
jgi:hypothetical protein